MKKKQLLTDLTDEQCEKVVGGVGRVLAGGSPAGAGVAGWFGGPTGTHGLASAGFTPPPATNPNTPLGVVVKVPGDKA